jgi:membrane protease YdiL (CAAX protease family)
MLSWRCPFFGLLHVPNAFFGQSVSSTVQQMAFAFAVGLNWCVIRRLAGTLILTMGLHAIWDFSVFIQDHSGLNLEDKPVANAPIRGALPALSVRSTASRCRSQRDHRLSPVR